MLGIPELDSNLSLTPGKESKENQVRPLAPPPHFHSGLENKYATLSLSKEFFIAMTWEVIQTCRLNIHSRSGK